MSRDTKRHWKISRKQGFRNISIARLADAHELVPKLKGPFDFVFSDADKDWYRNYFDAVAPKLVVGGCYTTHNVSGHGRGWFGLGSLCRLSQEPQEFRDNL